MSMASRPIGRVVRGCVCRVFGMAIVILLVVGSCERLWGEELGVPEVQRAQQALVQARNDRALIPKARQAAEEALRAVLKRHSLVCELRGSLHRRHDGESIRVPDKQLVAIANECLLVAETHAAPMLELPSDVQRIEAFRLAWCGFTLAGHPQGQRYAAERAIRSLVAWTDTLGPEQAKINHAIKPHAKLIFDVNLGWGILMDYERNYPEALKSVKLAEQFIQMHLPNEIHARSVCSDSKGLVLIHLGEYALALQAFRDSLGFMRSGEPEMDWAIIDRREKICKTLARIGNLKELKTEATVLARELDRLVNGGATLASMELSARGMVIEACLATDCDPTVADRCCDRIDELAVVIDQQRPDSAPEQIGLLASRIPMARWKLSRGDKAGSQRSVDDANRRLQGVRKGAQRIGPGDDLLADYDYQLGLANMAMGQYRTAAAHFDKHRQLAWNRNLDSLVATPLYSHYLINAIEIAPQTNAAVNLAWQAPNDPRIAEMTATWLLNSRQQLSIALEEQIKSIPKLRASTAEVVTVREPGPTRDPKKEANADAERQRALEWINRDAERSRAAAQRWPGATSTNANRWLSVEQFQRELQGGDVAVLYARVEPFHWVKSQPVSLGARYGAWIIKAAAGKETPPPRFVDLGQAEAIDSLIGKWRDEIGRFYEQSASEQELKRQASLLLQELSMRLFQPLRMQGAAEFANLKRLRILPDSKLWMAPFSALPFQGKEFLVEAVELELMRSGHQLFPRHEDDVEWSASVMFGDPDFNAIDADIAVRSPVETLAVPATTKVASKEFGQLRFGKLDTAVVGAALNGFDQGDASIVTRRAASEAALRALRQPYSLIISSHGYWLPVESHGSNPDQEAGQQMARAMSGDLSEHPWIRSGFVLAGFNQLKQAANGNTPRPPADNDGNVTAYDVLRLDLRGTKLVVLAACSTGVGDTQTGESVASLWQAFHLAGASDVVATLWDIPDIKLTSAFVADFLGEYRRSSSAASSLRSVQLNTIKHLRDAGQSDHPVFWAGFVATSR